MPIEYQIDYLNTLNNIFQLYEDRKRMSIVDNDKIHAKIQENKAKPKAESKFQRKMREMMEQAEEQKAKKGKK